MKYAMYAATLALTAILANAQQHTPSVQKTTASNASQSLRAIEVKNRQLLTATLLRSHAESVNRTLRVLAERLQTISVHAAAGELTAEQSERLKLAEVRTTIARLETTSAVYESQLASIDDQNDFSDSELVVLRAERTVSVKEHTGENSR